MITKQKFALLFVAGFILTKNDFQPRPFTHAAQSPKVIQSLPVQVFSTAPAAPCPAAFTPPATPAPLAPASAAGISQPAQTPPAGVSTDTKRTREEAMASLGLTEESLEELTPEQRAEFEKLITDCQNSEDDADQESGFNWGSLCTPTLIGTIVTIAIGAYLAYSPERRTVIKEFLQSIKSKLPEPAQRFIDGALSQISGLTSGTETPSALATPPDVPTPYEAPAEIKPPATVPASAPQESQPQSAGWFRRPAKIARSMFNALMMATG